jgi:hypothetical protein
LPKLPTLKSPALRAGKDSKLRERRKFAGSPTRAQRAVSGAVFGILAILAILAMWGRSTNQALRIVV